MQMILSLDLPDELGAELQAAASLSRMSAPAWAAQLIESEIAARRLPTVTQGRNGARLPDDGDIEPEGYPVRLEQML